ncbi:hypothetical protein F511_28587 [Dorcoceras hygrometricum]|uniref:Dystroglycan-like n=1 Tax=Dorcoceras hygrometricum TaxID=472368 RepID=A0A2Z7BSM1_9LAMI|nr:hypothetical protein F511_28587 [Dorcoceras hygrometricum]
MASSLYSNAQHVDFESVLGLDDPGMVSMFEALVASGLRDFLGCPAVVYEDALVDFFENSSVPLVASGLRDFLGCPAVVYEDALVDFFENSSVRNGVVFSTVGGQIVEISEKLFAETFELPIDGLGDLSEMPKDTIFDARSIVSLSGEPINLSGRKNQMKMPYRLLCDIVAKAISVKAGSFNAITVEKFSLLTAVVCGVKMNWAKFLFGVLKRMFSAKSKQAKGFAIQISRLLATFPTVELGDSSEFPASKILSKKTVLRFVSINDRDGAEEVTGAAKKKAVSKKRTAADIEAAVPKKKRSLKKKSVSSLELVEVAEEALVVEPLDVEEPRCSSADAVDLIIQQVLDETRAADAPADITEPAVTVEKNWYDLPYADLVKQWEAERPVVTASDTEDEDIATADVAPADEVQQVQDFEAPISAEEVLSADEIMSLDDILLSIPVDIPLPSTCMEVTQIKMGQMIKIPGVTKWTWFLKHLLRIPADDKGKEILVEKDPVKGNPAKEHFSLICADIDLLVDLRAKVIDEVATFFNSFSLKKLATINIEEMYKKEEQVLSWGETESPQEAIQRKFYILLKYRTISVWKFLEAWRANFAPGQGSSAVDIQRWADVCLEAVEFCAQRLLPVGSIRSCRSLQLSASVSSFAPNQPTVFAVRVSQFCSVFVNKSLFSWLPSTDISEFLSSIALDRTILRSVQRSQDSFAVAPSVQISLEPHQSSSSSSSSSSLHFDQTDIDATASSQPTISPDLSAVFADFQAALSEQIFASQSDISSRMHKLEQSVCDSLRDQADIFKNQIQGARQETRTLDDVHTIRFNEFRKNFLTQNATIFQGLADVRQVVDAVNAKVDIMASRLNDIQKDAEANKEALSHQLLEFHSQAQENHSVIHAQLSELVDYIHRGRADKKGESGSRGPQQPAATQITGSAVTPTFEQRVQMTQRRIVQTVLYADANRAMSQESAERDRERRRKEARQDAIWTIGFEQSDFEDIQMCLIGSKIRSDSGFGSVRLSGQFIQFIGFRATADSSVGVPSPGYLPAPLTLLCDAGNNPLKSFIGALTGPRLVRCVVRSIHPILGNIRLRAYLFYQLSSSLLM